MDIDKLIANKKSLNLNDEEIKLLIAEDERIRERIEELEGKYDFDERLSNPEFNKLLNRNIVVGDILQDNNVEGYIFS